MTLALHPITPIPSFVISARTILLKLSALVLCLLMQGPAMLVQEVAWLRMLITYTQERGWKQGVIDTFDGEHPCELCKVAENMRQQGDEPPEPSAPGVLRPSLSWAVMLKPSEKIELSAPLRGLIAVSGIPWDDRSAGREADAPSTPPPRFI